MLRNEVSTRDQMRTVKVSYEEDLRLAGGMYELGPRKEIVVSMQRLVLLVPNDKVELLGMFTNDELGVLGACHPRLHSDTAELDDDDADVLPKGSLRLLETAMKDC